MRAISPLNMYQRPNFARFQEPELEDTLDLDSTDELDLGAGMRSRRPRNIVEKLEIARMKRALDRGDKLSPSELATLGASAMPDAKDLIDRNKQLREPSKFTLSPVRALIRSL